MKKIVMIEKLKLYDKEYYNQGTPKITDTEYDLLKEKAKKLYPTHPYFNSVGAEVERGKKVKLPFVLGSLDKVKSDNVEKWTKERGALVASHKLDGVSFMVTYENGKVIFASTRGNGVEGQDITDKIKLILPEIDIKDVISLRGELLLFNEDHMKLGFKNRRNGVAGLISKDDIDLDVLKLLHPIFYEVLDAEYGVMDEEDIDFGREEDRLDFIEGLGLNVVPFKIIKYNENIVEELTEMLMESKVQPYDTDGIVLTENDSERENVMLPSNKVAFKVNTEAVKVKVKKVEWNLGRTGKITPLVYIEPVELDGVTISKATGFNYEFILTSGIDTGAVVGLVRSGGVIPFITEVFEKVEPVTPDVCPACGSRIKHIGVDLVCQNKDCYDSKVRQIAHFFKTMGSEFISETTIRNLGVESIEDVYNLDELEIAQIEGFGIKKAEQVYYEIQKTLKVTPDKLLAAFGISGVGKTLSAPILEKYTFDELFSVDRIEGIEGVGEILSDNIVKNINKFGKLYEFLKEKGLEFVMKEKSNISGLVFTLTGKMPMKRDVVTQMISAKGGYVKGISKNTNYLVTDDMDSGSIKNQKAQKFGTKIISFDELMDMIE